ncbi:NmrA family NAD(P)-binding protein [Mycolicibacterium cosmeticum]|uniref:NmrA family NAD(P)-binding protein n=1 Tax=Mycolicibacterium cosmeticum TaxID=258533 RepID=UPI00320469ED
MTTVLVTTAGGDTGRPLVEHALGKGLRVRALVRTDDARADRLRDSGAEVVVGDLLSLRDVRAALDGVQRAYFNFPVGEGLVEAAVMFAQAGKEQGLEAVLNMSQIQSRPAARSKATQNHWLSEQVFAWSGIPATTLRVTFFMEWLTYIAGLIRHGRYVMPFDPDSRFAPITAQDIASTAATILAEPQRHAGRTYTLTGPVEYSHRELSALVGHLLSKDLAFEQVSATTFVELLGIPGDTAKSGHFQAVLIDLREGRLAGVSDAAATITGHRLTTIEEFVAQNRPLFA